MWLVWFCFWFGLVCGWCGLTLSTRAFFLLLFVCVVPSPHTLYKQKYQTAHIHWKDKNTNGPHTLEQHTIPQDHDPMNRDIIKAILYTPFSCGHTVPDWFCVSGLLYECDECHAANCRDQDGCMHLGKAGQHFYYTKTLKRIRARQPHEW